MILGFYANLMSILAFLSSPEPIKDYQYPMRRLLVYIVTLCGEVFRSNPDTNHMSIRISISLAGTIYANKLM